MYLKRLELYGFKSFADRTRLEFGPGVTAIVGPNGSGKSNLVDAVRWVLGEQSARQLRGNKMEDVIFAGTQTRKGVGLAEVVLVLDNEDGRLPIDYGEVVLARRVDRAGGSDYLLNGQRVRLRDVQELLYDTAIGREAYSIVSQGKIDEILSARDEDRRELLDEAAGIVRYKARKREALRRLEEARQRLARLQDIRRELADRLDGLTQQARKAHLYRQWREELARLEIRVLGSQLHQVQARLDGQQEVLRQVCLHGDALRERLRAAEAERLHWLQQVAAHEEAAEAARIALAEAERALEGVRTQEAVLQERAAHLDQQRQQLERRLQELDSTYQSQRQAAAQLAQRAEDLDRVLAEAQGEKAEQQRQLESLRAEVQRLEAAVAATRQEHFAAVQRLHQLRNEQAAREREQAQLEQRAQRLRERLEALSAERRRLEQEQADAQDRWRQVTAAAEAAAAEEARWREQLRQARAQAQERTAQVQRWRQEQGELGSRLRVLEELERDREGYAEGVRRVLAGRDAGDPAFSGIRGVVGELLVVPAQLELAVEVALGASVHHLVAETAAAAERAIEALKRARAGRATFLPLDSIRPSEPRPEDRRLDREPGAVAWALEAVQFEPSLRPAVAHLLGRILIAQDLPSARRLARASGFRYRIVTLEGDVVHPGGAMTGGHDRRRQGAGLLARRRQLQTLRERMAQLARAIREGEEQARRAQRAVAEAEAQLEAALQRRQQQAIARGQLEQQLAALAGQLARLAQDTADLEAELDELAKASGPGEPATPAQLAEAEERCRAIQQRLAQEEAQLEGARRRLDQLAQRAAAVAARYEGVARERDLIRAQSQQAQGDLQGIAAQRRRLEEEVRRWETERAQLEARREALRRQLAEGRALVERHRQALAQCQERRRQAAQAANQREQEAVELRRQLDASMERRRQLEVVITRLQGERDRLQARLKEQYGLTEPPPDAGGQQEDLQPRIDQLRRRMASLGEVNLAAVEEHERVCQRYAFLELQCQDLERAQKALETVIAQMDREMERLFRVAYERLRVEFREVFRELFGGGSADLVLGEGDPLETGVQIVAQPPGKNLQHLSLLSGGERALTAIALLLALIRVKPTPFCLLDEIDAALDDRNVDRFARYLRRFPHTQFIVVTHQKATMAVADVLYGVTMPHPGVSRVVSVKLAEVAAEREPAGGPSPVQEEGWAAGRDRTTGGRGRGQPASRARDPAR